MVYLIHSAKQAYRKIICSSNGSFRTVAVAQGISALRNGLLTNPIGLIRPEQGCRWVTCSERWSSTSVSDIAPCNKYLQELRPGRTLKYEQRRQKEVLRSNLIEAETIKSHLERIGLDVRRKGRINRQNLEGIADLIERGAVLGDDGAEVLKYCSKDHLPDLQRFEIIQLYQKFWGFIEEEDRKSHKYLEILLKCYTDMDFKEFDPWQILVAIRATPSKSSIESLDTTYLNRIYYLTLLSYCQRGDLPNAAKVLQLVKTAGFLVDETYFNALIVGNSRSGDLAGAKAVLTLMKSSHVNPTTSTYTALMRACIEHNDLGGLTNVYSMSRRDVSLTEHDIIELASMSILNGNKTAFEKILSWLPSASATVDSVKTFNLIVALIHAGHTQAAMQILSNWQRGLHLSLQGFGVSFIKELVYANVDTGSLIALCQELVTKEHNKFAFNTAAEFRLRKKQFQEALTLFKVMKEQGLPLRPHYFWPMIIYNFDAEGLAGITKTLQSMVSLNVLPDWETYVEHIIPKLFSVESNPVQVAKILKEILNISYSSDIFAPEMYYLLQQKRLGDAATLAKRFKSNLPQPNLFLEPLFRCLLHVDSRDNITANIKHAIPILDNVSAGKPSEDKSDYVGKFILRFLDSVGSAKSDPTEFLIQSVEKEQIAISESSAKIIQSRIGRYCNFKIDQQLQLSENLNSNKGFNNSKEMDVQSLECHVQELKSKGMNTRGTLRRLFIKHCQDGDLDKAVEIQRQFKKVGEITDGMKGALLALHIRTGNLEEACQLYTELSSKKRSGKDWNLDLYKLVDLVTLLADRGRVKDAKDLLFNETCKYPAPESGNLLTRNVVKMLEAFSKNRDAGGIQLKEILDFVFEKRVISASSPVLSVLIKFLLQQNEVLQALELFEGYAKAYKLTPGNQLMAYAVLKDKLLLERYMKANASVHGTANATHQLACSFSDTGHLREAEQIFTELGSKFDLTKVRKYCEYLAERREVTKILNLAQVVSNTKKSIDTSGLYLIALQSCQAHQDRENLVLILDRMEHDLPICPSPVMECVENIKAQLLIGIDT